MMNDRPISEIAEIIMSMRLESPVYVPKLDNLASKAKRKEIDERLAQCELEAIERGDYESKPIRMSDYTNPSPRNLKALNERRKKGLSKAEREQRNLSHARAMLRKEMKVHKANETKAKKRNDKEANIKIKPTSSEEKTEKRGRISKIGAVLISPDGKEHTIKHVTNFCNEHDLNASCIHYLLIGKNKQHKGWTLKHDETRRCASDVGSIPNP